MAAPFRCSVCKKSARLTPGAIVECHPAVVAFRHDRGLPLQHGFDDLSDILHRLETGDTRTEQPSVPPPRVRVTVETGDGSISFDREEGVAVLAVHE